MQPLLQRKSRFTYSESAFVALGTQHAKRMHVIVICDVFGTTVFSTLSYKRHDFREKKKLRNTKCVF